MDPLDNFPRFMADVKARLEMGRENYKDESFSKMPSQLALEVDEEILDSCAWLYILRERLRAIRAWITSREEKLAKQ